MVKTKQYLTIIQKDDTGNFNVSFPGFPGCYTCGSTYEEAVANASEALELWIESTNHLDISNSINSRHIITFTTLQLA